MIIFSYKQNVSYVLKTYTSITESVKKQIEILYAEDKKNGSDAVIEFEQEKKIREDYLDNYKSTVFIMLFSYFEEYLYHASKSADLNDDNKQNKGSGIKRFKPALIKLKYDLQDSEWDLLNSFGDVRNALLHANGMVNLVDNIENLEITINKLNKAFDREIIYIKDLWSDATKDAHPKSNPPRKLKITEDFNFCFAGTTCNFFQKNHKELSAYYLMKSKSGDEYEVYEYKIPTQKEKRGKNKSYLHYEYEYRSADGSLIEKTNENTFYIPDLKINLYK